MNTVLRFLVVALVAAGTQAARADALDETMATCSQQPALASTIDACTAGIESGKLGNDDLAAAYNNRGSAHRTAGEIEKAIADFTKAIELDPILVPALTNRASAYGASKQYELAIADLDRAIRLRPTARAYLMRSGTNARLGRYEATLQDAAAVLRLEPDNVAALTYRGRAYLELGKVDLGFADFDRAVRLAPDSGVAYAGRGDAYLSRHDAEKAFRDFDQALHFRPDDPIVLGRRALASLMLHQYDRAIPDLTRAASLAPENPGILEALCWAEAESGRPADQVVADCSKALLVKPDNNASSLKWRALGYFRNGKYREAMADTDKVLAQSPRDAVSLYLRGVCEHRLGDTAKGDQDIAAAKAIDPQVDKYIVIANP